MPLAVCAEKKQIVCGVWEVIDVSRQTFSLNAYH